MTLLGYVSYWASALFGANLCVADPVVFEPPQGRNLYIVIANTDSFRVANVRNLIPAAAIYRLQYPGNQKFRRPESRLLKVQEFPAIANPIVSHFPEYRLLFISARYKDSNAMHIVQTDFPSTNKSWPMAGFDFLGFVQYSNTVHLAGLEAEDSHSLEQITLICPARLKAFKEPIAAWQHVVRHQLVEAGQTLRFVRRGFEGLDLGIPPSSDMPSGSRYLILQNDGVVVMRPHVAQTATRDRGTNTLAFCYDRRTSKWRRHEVKGDRTELNVVGRYLFCRIGWSYPEENRYGPVFTGQWLMVDLITGNRQNLSLGRDVDVLMAEEPWLIVRRDDALEYYPFLDGTVDEREHQTLVQHKDLKFSKAVFWGPN